MAVIFSYCTICQTERRVKGEEIFGTKIAVGLAAKIDPIATKQRIFIRQRPPLSESMS